MSCREPVQSVYEAQPSPTNWEASMRGEVTHCAFDRVISVDEMSEAFEPSLGFVDPGLSTAVHKYRLQYWTERGEGEPVLTSAALYIPETRRADPSPLLVIGHGGVGIADACAPSLEDPGGFHTDWRPLVYSYVGDGWVAIMPDNPGLGTPGTTAVFHSIDEGHTMLDATRAARKVFKEGTLSERNALIGHSAGGHAVYSAAAFAAGYGLDGTLDAAIALNPFWLPMSAWGALLSDAGGLLINTTLLSITMQFFTGHLAVYEGEESALDAFLPRKRDEAQQMLDGGCLTEVTSEERGPPSIGVHGAADLYQPEYTQEVGICGFTDTCETELAQTWRARWAADRPPPDPSIPLIQWTGAQDDFNLPTYQRCGLDRLEAQGADITACVERDSNHGNIVSRTAGWIRAHLTHVLLDGEAPEPCERLTVFDPELGCDLPIPNSTDPADP
jgi:hypothetical protein